MARLWSDFSAPVRGEGNKLGLTVVLWLSMSGLGILSFAQAASQPVAEVSAVPTQSYTIERLDHLQPHEAPRVGDQLQMRIQGIKLGDSKVRVQDLKVEWLEPQTNLGEIGFDWLDKMPGASASDEFRFWVAAIKPGTLVLPAFALKDPAGKEVARSVPLQIEVRSAISPQDPEPDQPYDLEPPVGLKFPIFWVIGLGLVAACAVAGLIYFVWRRWRLRHPQLEVKKEPILPEHQIALRSLLELEQMNYPLRGEFKKYYFGISEILKVYVGIRFRIDAPEATTREMLTALSDLIQLGPPFSNELSDSQVGELRKLFGSLDRVKFTDYQPEASEALEVLKAAREWVELTRRKSEVIESKTPSISGEWAGHAIR